MPSYDVAPGDNRPVHTTDVTFSDSSSEFPPGWTKDADGHWVESATGDAPSDSQSNTKDSREVTPSGRSVAPTEASKPEQPKAVVQEESKPQSYVWLADGSVLRANDEDLPGASGAQNPHGHWQKDGKVYEIVGVYPIETEA